MLDAFSLGSLLIPTVPTATVVSLIAAVAATAGFATRAGLDTGRLRGAAEGAAWVGIAGARLGYVAWNWSAFRLEPWTALFLWQPGYLPSAGIALGAAYAAWHLWPVHAPEQRRALGALAAGYAVGATLLGSLYLVLVALAPPHAPKTGDRVADFALHDLDGRTVRLSDLAGRGVVLNFWATWCPPCRREMPLLDAFQADYERRGITVVGVALEEPARVVASFVREMGVRYPIWLDARPPSSAVDRTREIYSGFAGVGLPTTIFIDRNGVVRGRHVGELNRAILEEKAEEILR